MKDLDVKKIQPTKGYVLVEPAKAEEKTKSGIILSESDSEKPQYGVVLAVGESGCDCDGDCCDSKDCCSDEDCCCGDKGYCEPADKMVSADKKEIKSDKKDEDFECCGGHCHDCEEDGEGDSEKSCCSSDEEGCCSDKAGCCSDGDYFDCECDCDCESSPVKVGDKVIYKKWGGNEFKIGDTEYQFLKFEDILAVINN